jgi:general secretion pathway protein I
MKVTSRSRKRRVVGSERSGFTLLEVLVAVAILSIALVVLLGLRNQDVNLVDATRHLTVATALARMKVVETGLEGFPELGEAGGEFGEGYPDFHWRRVVSPTPFDYVREVRVSVTWGQNDREGVELVNYVFQEKF